MRILHFATSRTGGAGLAAASLNDALIEFGITSNIISRKLHDVSISKSKYFRNFRSSATTFFQSSLVQKTDDLVTPISYGFIRNIDRVIESHDIFHFHSFYNLMNFEQISSIVKTGKPIFITLHDQRFFTGGCHCSRECHRYEKDCKSCPQVRILTQNLVARSFKKLRSAIGKNNVHFIAPSNWMANLVSKSPIAEGLAVSTISNIVNIFPKNRNSQVKDNQIKKFVFVSSNINDSYKGFRVLNRALELIDRKVLEKIEFTFVGKGNLPGLSPNLKINHKKFLSQYELSEEYCEADALVLPSTQDNLPNVMIEALLYGLPIIGSSVGGITETLKKFNLPLCESGNASDLAKQLTLFDPGNYDSEEISRQAKRLFSRDSITREHIELYRNAL